MAGRPRFEPSDEQRQNVDVLTALGLPQDLICRIVRDARGKPITENTLRKYFRPEISAGVAKLKARMGLFLIATIEGRDVLPGMKRIESDQARAHLLILFMKSRMGWVEKKVTGLESNRGKPLYIYKTTRAASQF